MRGGGDAPKDIFEALTGVSAEELAEERKRFNDQMEQVDEDLEAAIEELDAPTDQQEFLMWYTENREDIIDSAAKLGVLLAVAEPPGTAEGFLQRAGQVIAKTDLEATGGVER